MLTNITGKVEPTSSASEPKTKIPANATDLNRDSEAIHLQSRSTGTRKNLKIHLIITYSWRVCWSRMKTLESDLDTH